MAQDMAVAEAMYQHVLGTGDPSLRPLEEGKLPLGWAPEYRRLLQVAEAEWLSQPVWPRRLVAAMHYVLIYLDIRYSAWRSLGGGERRNEETERELVTVTAPTRIFFARSFSVASE